MSRKQLVLMAGGAFVGVLVLSVATVLVQSNKPFFGAKAACDERQGDERFGHEAWVRCFKSIAYRSFPERLALAASRWAAVVVVPVALIVGVRVGRGSRGGTHGRE